MKIAYVYDVIYPYVVGGVEKRIWVLASRLAQRGHEVTIFGMKHWEGNHIIYKEGVRLWGVCPPQELFMNGKRSIKEAIYYALRLLNPLLKERFDVIDCQNFPYFPCFPAKVASTLRRSKLVLTWHEVWDDYWVEYLGDTGFLGKAVERIVSRLGNQVVANSEATKRGLEMIGVKRAITVIPSGVDFEKARGVSHSNSALDVIYVGRLLKEKNVDLLIKSIGYAKKEMPNIQCMVIGDGPEKENLNQLIHQLDLRDNIRLKEPVKGEAEVFSSMKAAKVFVHPSIREGLGLTVLEACACGLPTITVNHPRNAACDLIVNGENGFICQMSEQDMARNILQVVSNSDNWQAKCQEFARRYDWDVIVDSVEKIYGMG